MLSFLPTDFQLDDFPDQAIPMDVESYLEFGQYVTDAAEIETDMFGLETLEGYEDFEGAGGIETSPPQFAAEQEAPIPHGGVEVIDGDTFFDKNRSVPKSKDRDLSDTEKKYIENALSGNAETAKFVSEVARIVADVEQEFMDPTHRYEGFSPKMLDLPTGVAGLFEEEFPDTDYLIFPPSPEAEVQVNALFNYT